MTLNQLKYIVELSKDSSINEAAKKLFISQPSLTASLKSLEQEVGFEIFARTKSGISLTVKGREFLGYAKSVIEQYDILDAKYISHKNIKRTFHVSMQHYTFAVQFTVEGDAIYDYILNKDGVLYIYEDTSRDAYAGGNTSRFIQRS